MSAAGSSGGSVGPSGGDRLAFAAIVAIAAVGALLWLTTGLSAAAFGDGWPEIRAGDVAHALLALPQHPGDPAAAWPRRLRAGMAPPAGFYATLALVLASLGGIGGGVWALLGGRAGPRERHGEAPSANWAGRRDLRPLVVRGPEPGRVILGRVGRRLVGAEERQSVIVVAPAQSGKTTALAVPAILEWRGPVLATSVKTDLLNETHGRRRQLGRVMIYDPTEATGYSGSGWTPLAGSGTWHGAQRMAARLCAAAQPSGEGLANADFWYAAAGKQIAPLIHAAAVSGATIADVLEWIDIQDNDPALDVLEEVGPAEAVRALQACARREPRQRSSIYTTAETVLAAYADPRVLASARLAEITPEALLDGGANTLYLCAPAHEQRRLAPLFATLVEDVVSAVYEAASARGGPIAPALLIVGDELANIAPLPSLAEIASTGAGQGIQLLSVFQDLGQVRQRWGEGWRTVVNNHRAKLFGAGLADPETLAYVREVTGESEYRQLSDTEGRYGDRSRTEATTYRALAPASVVREGAPGTAVLVYGHLPPARLRLRPFYRDRALRRLARGREPEAKATGRSR
jgi:type IV secretion system protein VirD4